MIAGVRWAWAMTVAMLGFPLTSVLVVAVFLQADAIALTPLVSSPSSSPTSPPHVSGRPSP